MIKTEYSKGILPYIPFFYVIWSDDLLSVSEIQVVKKSIETDPTLMPEDKRQMYSWLDKKIPPKNEIIKSWQQLITESEATLIESETYPLETFSRKVTAHYWKDASPNQHLQQIERNLGIQPNHYNHLFHVEVKHQTYSNHFDASILDNILNREGWKVIEEFRQFLGHEIFHWEVSRNKEKARETVLAQVQHLAKAGWGAYGFSKAYGGQDDLPTYASIFEHLMFVDGSLAVKFGVQFGLFGGSIQNLGNEEQRTQLPHQGRNHRTSRMLRHDRNWAWQ